MKEKPQVALITGASSGLGAEFARQLAQRQVDLVLTARRRDRLEALRDELVTAHDVRVSVIEADLARPGGAEQIYEAVGQLRMPISLLINNAGFGIYGTTTDQTMADIHGMIQVNATSLTTLARLAAADMAARGDGYVLNVASFAAFQPIPRYAVYSATKAYVVALSLAMHHELLRHGVRLSVLVPGFAETEFHKVARHQRTLLMRLMTLQVPHIVSAGLRGVLRGKTVITPGLGYKLIDIGGRYLPRRFTSGLAALTVKTRSRPPSAPGAP